jgi:hypothetical protein
MIAGKAYGSGRLGDPAERVKEVFGKPTPEKGHRLFYEDGHVSFGITKG